MHEDSKLKRLQKIIDDQSNRIDVLELENESLIRELENEKKINENMSVGFERIVDELIQKKTLIDKEYEQVFNLKEKYQKTIIEISELKNKYKKELQKNLKQAKKDVL